MPDVPGCIGLRTPSAAGGWTSHAPRYGAAVSRAAGLVLACAAMVAFTATLAWAALALPELKGRITDNAQLISAEDRAIIETQLRELEEKSTDQVAVVTVTSLQDVTIEEFGLELARAWAIGQKDKDNGIVLIVAPNERKVRIEVGRRLESQMTDAMSKIIIENGILPAFRRGDFSGGIRAGVRDINDVLLGDEEAVKERAKGGLPGPGPDYVALIFIAIWLSIFVFIIYQQYKQAQQTPADIRRGRRTRRWDDGDGHVVVIPGGSGGWSGGDSGGGWSGGGGDFGGGGSSGSW